MDDGKQETGKYRFRQGKATCFVDEMSVPDYNGAVFRRGLFSRTKTIFRQVDYLKQKNQMMRCPICGREFEPSPSDPALPFCSSRCKMIDLGRWLDEKYTFFADKDEHGEEETAEGWGNDENH